MSRRLTPNELSRLKRIARQRGGALLSQSFVGVTLRLRFRCEAGHEWTQTPKKLEQGRWCIACSRARKNQEAKARSFARLSRVVARRGGTILSPTYEWSRKAMRYRCSDGHEWSAVPSSILHGSWCPECARFSRGERFDSRNRGERRLVIALVKKFGGEILPPGYRAASLAIRVRCARGHEWRTLAQRILAESWCPACRREARLDRMRALAQERGGECLATSCRSLTEVLEWRCAQGHRFRSTGDVVRAGTWCARCRSNGRGDIEQLRQMARDRRGMCLSPVYRGSKTKHRWRCREGHVWLAQPGPVLQGSWCPICSLRSRHRTRLGIADMRQTALERGGACLSRKYQGSHAHLRWRCARGHVWDARAWQVRQGHWCPICSRRVPGTLDGMRLIAGGHAGRCLTRAWTDHRQPVKFECARGHRFALLSVVAKTGLWCPVCRAGEGRGARIRA